MLRLFCVLLTAVLAASVANASVESEVAFHRGIVAFNEEQMDEFNENIVGLIEVIGEYP